MFKGKSKAEIINDADKMFKVGSFSCWLFIALLAVSNILQLFNINFLNSEPSTVTLPVSIDYNSDIDSEKDIYNKGEYFAQIAKPTSSVSITTNYYGLKLYDDLRLMVIFILSLLIFHKLRSLTKSAKKRRPFEKENAAIFQKIGSILIYMSVLLFLMDFVATVIFDDFIRAIISKSGFTYTGVGLYPSNVDFSLIFIGSGIKLTSLFFVLGKNIQEENDMTI